MNAMIDPDRITASLEADPFRDDYPLAMLAEDIAHEKDPKRRAAYSARMLERCQGAEFSVARVDDGVWLWVEMGDQKTLVAMPLANGLQLAIMLLNALAKHVEPPIVQLGPSVPSGRHGE